MILQARLVPIAAAATVALAGCVTAPPADDLCNSAKVARHYGRVATPEVRAEIARETGAKTIRWLYPDSIITMDYSAARLNVTMDKGTDVIRSAKCG